jgi:hypothetical protein
MFEHWNRHDFQQKNRESGPDCRRREQDIKNCVLSNRSCLISYSVVIFSVSSRVLWFRNLDTRALPASSSKSRRSRAQFLTWPRSAPPGLGQLPWPSPAPARARARAPLAWPCARCRVAGAPPRRRHCWGSSWGDARAAHSRSPGARRGPIATSSLNLSLSPSWGERTAARMR